MASVGISKLRKERDEELKKMYATDEDWAAKEFFRSLIEAVNLQWDSCEIDARVKAVALQLCEWDGGNPKAIVMGYSGRSNLYVEGREKQMVALQLPMRPLWVNYLDDARKAIEAVEKEKGKPNAPD